MRTASTAAKEHHAPGSLPRRVALVYEGVAYGGIEEYILLMLKNLDPARYASAIIIPGYNYKYCPPQFIEGVAALGVPVLRTSDIVRSRAASSLTDIFNLQQLLAAEQFDIVHIHNSRPDGGRRATLAARLAGVRGVIRSEHLPPSSNNYWHSRLSLKPQDWLTDYIIAGSDSCLAEQFQLLGRNPRKTLRIYYGIALDRFNPNHDVAAAKRRLGLDPAIPVVGKIARLSPEKGYPYFFDAAAEIIKQGRRVAIVVVGNGPLEHELHAQCAALGIQEHVHFVGFQPDTVPYIQAMDVAVMASVNEGISLAMLECMAMGKAIVATNEPSFAETVIDGESGMITPLRDAPALAAGIIKVLDEPALGARLGHAAYRRVHEVFDIRTNVDRMMDLYDSLCAAPRPVATLAAVLSMLFVNASVFAA